jgi:hypothetical protein
MSGDVGRDGCGELYLIRYIVARIEWFVKGKKQIGCEVFHKRAGPQNLT